MDFPGREDIAHDFFEPMENVTEGLQYDERSEMVIDEPSDYYKQVEDGAVLYNSDEDFEYDDHHITDKSREEIKIKLTYNARALMPLETVDHGYVKKFRFTLLLPCPSCHVANHVEFDDTNREERPFCALCQGEKRFYEKVVYSVPIPRGTFHGSTITLPNAGHVYTKHIRGDVRVVVLDEPHERFLRVNDDVIVCFQINKLESEFGVTRILTLPWYEEESSIIIKTAKGCEVKDSDVFRLEGLGLLNSHEMEEELKHGDDDSGTRLLRTRGDIFVLFFVRSKPTVEPVKLKNVKLLPSSTPCDDTGDTLPVIPSGTPNLNESPPRPCHDNKQNGVKSPRKRRRNGEVNGSPKSNPSASANPLRYDIHPADLIPSEELANYEPFPDTNLLFLDRLSNHPGAIPLPFHESLVDEIPVEELESLWERRKYRSWWQRVSANLNAHRTDTICSDSKAKTRLKSLKTDCHCPVCLLGGPLFELEEETVDSSAEAAEELLTGKIGNYPEFDPKIILECRMNRCEVLLLIQRVKVYLTGPKAKGTT